MKKIMSKYDFEYRSTDIDYSEVITVPDQVLSMREIYQKYAVRGDINGLANGVRPIVRDDLDFDDSSVGFVPEEDLDVLQRSRYLRDRGLLFEHSSDDSNNNESSEGNNNEPAVDNEQNDNERREEE